MKTISGISVWRCG